MAALATIPYGFETLIFLPFPSPRPVGPLSHSSFFLAVPRVTWMSPGSLCMPSCGSESETVISASSLQPMLATEGMDGRQKGSFPPRAWSSFQGGHKRDKGRTQIRARDVPQEGTDQGTRLRHSRRGLPRDLGGRQ